MIIIMSEIVKIFYFFIRIAYRVKPSQIRRPSFLNLRDLQKPFRSKK
jgi:hypothetical protein